MERLDLRSRHHSQSARSKKRRRNRQFFQGGIWGFLILIFFIGAWFLLRIPELTIGSIESNGNIQISTENIQAEVKKNLLGSSYLFIPRNSIFAYPKAKIEASLIAAYPTLDSVEVNLKGFDVLSVTVHERAPYALWCTEAGGECYFLDRDAVIFSRAPDFSDHTYLEFRGGPTAGLGERYTAPETFSALSAFLDKLSGLSFTPLSVTLDDTHEFVVDLKEGGILRIAEHADFSRVFQNLSATVSSSDFEKRPRKNLQYIDLRFDDKVFYKFNP